MTLNKSTSIKSNECHKVHISLFRPQQCTGNLSVNCTPTSSRLLCALQQSHIKFVRRGHLHSNRKQHDTTSVNTFAIPAQRHSYIHACIHKETPTHPPILARIWQSYNILLLCISRSGAGVQHFMLQAHNQQV